MTKAAYLIVATDIHDPDAFRQYVEASVPLVLESGAEVLAATNDIVREDGTWARQRIALIKFPSLAEAEGFYHGEAYAPMKALRESASSADAVLAESPTDADDTMVEEPSAPYYLLGAATVSDPSWVPEYLAKVPPISARFGVQGLAMGGDFTTLEGTWQGEGIALLRFPSRQAFQDFWYGDEYRPMKELREANSVGPHISFAGVVN